MNKKEWKELRKKCFGKNKDERYHGMAMLMIYGIFLLVIVVVIRVGGKSKNYEETLPGIITPSPSSMIENPTKVETQNNYSYSYTVTSNGQSEVYLGKRVEDKEKFTAIMNGISIYYAILSGDYFIWENDTYHMIDTPNLYFKYCNLDKVLELVNNAIPTENGNIIKYTIDNQTLANIFQEDIQNVEGRNTIQIWKDKEQIKTITLNFTNYFSARNQVETTWTAELSYTDIGLTEDLDFSIR